MKKTKERQESICKHKEAFFTLNSPPLTRDETCSKPFDKEKQREGETNLKNSRVLAIIFSSTREF